MGCIFLIFLACLKSRFSDVDPHPGPRRPVLWACGYSVVMCGVCPRTLLTWPWQLNLQYNILLCSETSSMAAMQSEDVRSSFLFVGDLNDHYQEWVGSITTKRHGVATFDFSTVRLLSVGCWPDSRLLAVVPWVVFWSHSCSSCTPWSFSLH